MRRDCALRAVDGFRRDKWRCNTLAGTVCAGIEHEDKLVREVNAVTRAKIAFSNTLSNQAGNWAVTARTMRSAAVLAAFGLLAACGGNERPTSQLQAAQVNTIGVNAYLWRGALDTLSFAPLLSADSNGGVIVTDWYANPSNPNERVKVTVTILDQDLRADALRVSASRQVAQGGGWVDAPVQAATVQKLEDIILTKARDLRRKAITG